MTSLSASRRVRLFAFTAFYVAQGIPIGLITVAMPAWLAANGVGAGDVASFAAITGLPWGFKLLAGPMMDRFRFPALGGRRPWVILAQTGLVLAMASLAVFGGTPSDLAPLTAICFVINCFAGVQDVAVDGMAIDILPEGERGRANALMAFGQVAGFSASGAFCGWALINVGVSLTATMLTVGIAAILAIAVFCRERDGEKLLPWTAGSVQHAAHLHSASWASIGSNLFRALVLPTSLLLIVVTTLWRLSDGIILVAAPVLLTQELGWGSDDYANWMSAAGFVAAVIGVFLGPFIDRHGARTFFIIGLASSAVVYLVLGLSTASWGNELVWITAIFAMNLAIQMIFVAFIALHMSVCWSRVAATQFAIYMAWSNLARSIGSQVYGELSPYLEAGQELLLMAALSLLGAALLGFVSVRKHQERLNRLSAREPAGDMLADVPARY
jgi:PAT family beta-lactamase induction signal transducer AmpG